MASAARAWFCTISRSGMLSISPAPNTGVGMRNTTLLCASSVAKSGWLTLQPGASVRPVIVNRPCTPPSGEPSALRTKRASRTGPFALRNDGSLLVAWLSFANATCGFTLGLVPPIAGCEWQPPQLSRFIVGPRPPATSSTSLKSSLLTSKAASWVGVKPDNALPASAPTVRGPGSLALEGGGVQVDVPSDCGPS